VVAFVGGGAVGVRGGGAIVVRRGAAAVVRAGADAGAWLTGAAVVLGAIGPRAGAGWRAGGCRPDRSARFVAGAAPPWLATGTPASVCVVFAAGCWSRAASAPVAASALVDSATVTAPTTRVPRLRRDTEGLTSLPFASRQVPPEPALRGLPTPPRASVTLAVALCRLH
jgi:hypothetical protein